MDNNIRNIGSNRIVKFVKRTTSTNDSTVDLQDKISKTSDNIYIGYSDLP